MHRRVLGWVGCALVVMAGCGDWRADPDGLTEADLALLATMVLPVTPPDRGNEFSANVEVRRFGQQLFFDRGLAVARADGTPVACTDCHNPNRWFTDTRSENNVSQGVGFTARNSPGLVNVGAYEVFGWDGRADSVWGQSHHAFKSKGTMQGDEGFLLEAVRARYADRYQALFGPLPAPLVRTADGGLTPDVDAFYRNILKSWSAYLLTLESRHAPFDRFAQGEREALDVGQRRGLKLFLGKAGCIECHRGPNFSDHRFHALGIAQTGRNVPEIDLGRAKGLEELGKLRYRPPDAEPAPAPTEADRGRFRTKSLRQVAQTAPYFHAGQALTLKDVVWFYNQGGDRAGSGTPSPLVVPLHLSDDEQADVVAFLAALTGEAVPVDRRCDNARHDGGVFTRCAEVP